MEERAELVDVAPDAGFSPAGKDYAVAPVKKMLKANLWTLRETEQIDNYKTKPGGEDNPNFGKPVKKYVWGFKLNEPDLEANGQVYTAWTGAFPSEKSDMGKISDALLGSWSEIIKHKAADLLGLPIQIALKPGSTDPTRLVVDKDRFMPADESQSKVDVTTETKDVVVEPDTDLEAVEAVFGPDVKKVG